MDPNWRSQLSSLKTHSRRVVSPSVPSSGGGGGSDKENQNVFDSFDRATELFKSGAATITPAHVTRAKMLALSSSSDRAARAHDVASSCQWATMDAPLFAPSPQPDENDAGSDTSRPLQCEDDEEGEAGDEEGSAAVFIYQDPIEEDEEEEEEDGEADVSRGVAANLNALRFGGGESLDDPSFGRRYAAHNETCDTTASGHDAVLPAPLVRTPPSSPSSLRRALTLSPSLQHQHQQQAHREVYRDHRDTTTSARVVASPTQSKTDSDFSRRLARGFDEAGGEGAGAGAGFGEQKDLPAIAPPVSTVCDEWKEAISPEGKIYYYNRRTRESSWRVPANAVIVRLDNPAPTSAAPTPARLAPAPAAVPLSTASLHCPACAAPLAALAAVEASSTPDAGVFSFRRHVTACLGRAIAASSGSSSGSRAAISGALRDLRAAIDAVGMEEDLDSLDASSSRAAPQSSDQVSRVADAVFRPFPFDDQLSFLSPDLLDHSHSQSESQSYADETMTTVEVCPDCGRRFALGRLEKHRVGCRTINQKVVPSNSARKRIVGTPMELFLPGAAGVTPKRGGSVVTPEESGLKPRSAREARPFSSPMGRNLKTTGLL